MDEPSVDEQSESPEVSFKILMGNAVISDYITAEMIFLFFERSRSN